MHIYAYMQLYDKECKNDVKTALNVLPSSAPNIKGRNSFYFLQHSDLHQIKGKFPQLQHKERHITRKFFRFAALTLGTLDNTQKSH